MLFLESSCELGNRLIEFEPQIPTSVFHFTVVQMGAVMKMTFLIVMILFHVAPELVCNFILRCYFSALNPKYPDMYSFGHSEKVRGF